jgi:hypothetical protein
LRTSPAKERTVRDYTPEYESFRDDAVAVINGLAIMFAVVGMWTRPLYMGVVALLVALFGYFLNPRSKGGHILAVCLITVFAVLETYWWQGAHIF